MKSKKILTALTLAGFATLFTGSIIAQSGDDLISAVMYQDMEKVKQLAEAGVDLNHTDPNYGSTPLILACQYNMEEIGKYLIEQGANVNLGSKSGHTPLMAACSRSEALVALLLEHGADPSATLPDGTSAFTSATVGILNGSINLKVLDTLLERGADVDESAKSGAAAGYTCLMMAARNNKPDLVRYLVDKGADVNAQAGDGNTPLSLAKKEEDAQMVALLEQLGAK